MNPYSTYQLVKMKDGDIILERPITTLDPSNKVYHTVMEGETIQSIAYKYYGDSGRWADICDVNGILFPFEELYTNQQLIIPL